MSTPWSDDLNQMLRCPETLQPLSLLETAALGTLQDAIIDGRAHTTSGAPVLEAIEAAMVREDQGVAYPIRAGILNMLLSDRIDLSSLASSEEE